MKPRATALLAGLLTYASLTNASIDLAWAAPACPRLPAGLRCAALPSEPTAQRKALEALDLEGRGAVGRGDLVAAATAFGCLVERDPTSESAGNLAVVLREQGALGDALLVARCAERIAPPGPSRDRARARRLELERHLGLSSAASLDDDDAPSSGEATPAAAVGSRQPASVAPTPVEAARSRFRRGFTYAALAVAVTGLIGSGILFALARDRAQQFDAEQTANGYTQRARDLRTETQSFEISSWAGGGLSLVSLLAAGAVWRF